MRNIPNLIHRPRRLRAHSSLRDMLQETHLSPAQLIWPVFIVDGKSQRQPVSSMPGVERYSPDVLIKEVEVALSLGIRSVALFPKIENSLKNPQGSEAVNPKGLIPKTVQLLKAQFADLMVITDVALDPYSSVGHDGLVENGRILNDESVEILSAMAKVQAQAGADMVAPSDMMDGRVAAIRKTLDHEGFIDCGIISYCAKYASCFYGPFRDALDSAPRAGDKKTYQMNPWGSLREATREALLDLEEGADILLVKPALAYLDVIREIRQVSHVPVAAYQVSGEYAMIAAAAQNKWLNLEAAMLESTASIRRAGADVIFTYFARDLARLLQS